ncbi:MAG TPA: YciI family protein [Blastococcus sp.]|nr:YciI family protein [Blastococcus sp.]
MRYLMLLKATQPASPPPPELMEAIARLGEEATKSGALLDFAGLAPSAAGVRLELTSGDLIVSDGPFAEAREVVSYAVYEVRSKEEAVEWGTRFLDVHRKHWPGWEGSTDIHKVFGPEDMAPSS